MVDVRVIDRRSFDYEKQKSQSKSRNKANSLKLALYPITYVTSQSNSISHHTSTGAPSP